VPKVKRIERDRVLRTDFGPFVKSTPYTSLLLFQAFLGVITAATVVLAVALSERQRAEKTLHQHEECRCLALQARQNPGTITLPFAELACEA
jgi:hypothetical protein